MQASDESRVPDDPSKASGERLQIPGARPSGGRSRKVLQSGVPSQENSGQPSGDRLRFPAVQAAGHWSCKVPDWIQFYKEGHSDEPPDSHNVVVEQPAVEPTETPDDVRVSSKSTVLPYVAERSKRPKTKQANWQALCFTHFSKDLNCEVCKLTKIPELYQSVFANSSPDARADRIHLFGDVITADHSRH